jgi:hypothetical protein
MQGLEQISAISGSLSTSGPQSTTIRQPGPSLGDLPSIGVSDAEAVKSISSDFTKVLETYRVKSERVDNAVTQARSGQASGRINQQDMVKQLADLYTYAVDTQLLVRTSGQLTTGVRQLVTGQ